MLDFSVKRIENNDKGLLDYLLTKHYAQRRPSISFAFALLKDNIPVGYLTIGKPASHSLCIGVCGKEFSSQVYELNRLITDDGLPPNTLSWFVSQVLRQLKNEELIIVSYADSGMNHHGYIYQATNFIYTGATKSRTDKYTPSGKHSRHYDDKYIHLRKVRTSKHRYVYFTKNRKKYLKLLKYPVLPYPKGENQDYKLGDRQKTKVINKETGEEYYE